MHPYDFGTITAAALAAEVPAYGGATSSIRQAYTTFIAIFKNSPISEK